MKKKYVNMLSGSIIKGLFTIAMPIMVMNVLQSLFNIIDMRVLKSSGAGLAVGAVGACSVLISIITSLVIGISSGANVVIAKDIGRGDQESSRKAVGTAFAFAIVSGIALLIIGVLFAPAFLDLANVRDAELLPQATLYFRLYFMGVPILMVYNFCASALRAAGDTRRPMYYLVASGVLKVILNYIFVNRFQMGVAGVAVATIISWTLAASLTVWALVTNDGPVKLVAKYIRFYKTELQGMLRIGIPSGLQQAMYSIANLVISATVNNSGAAATTGISIANNYDAILYQIAMAPSFAVLPYVSQNVGAGNIKRARQAVSRGIMITAILGASFGALSAIFSTQLASFMSDDPQVIEFAREKMILISSLYFLQGINASLGESMKGIGKPMIPTIATFIFMCLIRFPWALWIYPAIYPDPANPNFTFLYLIWPIGWVLSILFVFVFFIPGFRKLQKKYAETTHQKLPVR